MLHAIEHNKAGRNFQDAVNWRALFSASEDSLTSSIFGHLFYLPDSMFWRLLERAAHNFPPLPSETCQVLSYEFWPRWDATGTTNTYSVEPDVFVRTTKVDIIIEAKRYDYNQQYRQQWENQILAYYNEYGTDSKEVRLLAVGGINHGDENPTNLTVEGHTVTVYKCRWRSLLYEINELRQGYTIEQRHIANILGDIITSFELHGYAANAWLANMPKGHLKKLVLGNGFSHLLRASIPDF